MFHFENYKIFLNVFSLLHFISSQSYLQIASAFMNVFISK